MKLTLSNVKELKTVFAFIDNFRTGTMYNAANML